MYDNLLFDQSHILLWSILSFLCALLSLTLPLTSGCAKSASPQQQNATVQEQGPLITTGETSSGPKAGGNYTGQDNLMKARVDGGDTKSSAVGSKRENSFARFFGKYRRRRLKPDEKYDSQRDSEREAPVDTAAGASTPNNNNMTQPMSQTGPKPTGDPAATADRPTATDLKEDFPLDQTNPTSDQTNPTSASSRTTSSRVERVSPGVRRPPTAVGAHDGMPAVYTPKARSNEVFAGPRPNRAVTPSADNKWRKGSKTSLGGESRRHRRAQSTKTSQTRPGQRPPSPATPRNATDATVTPPPPQSVEHFVAPKHLLGDDNNNRSFSLLSALPQRPPQDG